MITKEFGPWQPVATPSYKMLSHYFGHLDAFYCK